MDLEELSSIHGYIYIYINICIYIYLYIYLYMYPYIDLEELSSIHGLENTPNGQSNEHAGILLLYTSAKK